MRKLLISAALAATTLAAVPAAAQYRDGDRYEQRDQRDRYEDRRDGRWDDRRDHRDWNRHGPSRQAVHNLMLELDQVERRIDRSARIGAISRREAVSLSREANRIRFRLHRAGRDGLSGREFAELRVAVNRLRQHLRIERRDGDGRRW